MRNSCFDGWAIICQAANPRTNNRDLMQYKKAERNQLAKCMPLTQRENGSGGKTDTLPEAWFEVQVAEELNNLDLHLSTKGAGLWKLERFPDFIEESKILIRQQLAYLPAAARTPADGRWMTKRRE